MIITPQTELDYINQKIQINETCAPYSKRWVNLGSLYMHLAKLEEPLFNYPKAIKAYLKALVYNPSRRIPKVYAIIQRYLAGAYQNLGAEYQKWFPQ